MKSKLGRVKCKSRERVDSGLVVAWTSRQARTHALRTPENVKWAISERVDRRDVAPEAVWLPRAAISPATSQCLEPHQRLSKQFPACAVERRPNSDISRPCAVLSHRDILQQQVRRKMPSGIGIILTRLFPSLLEIDEQGSSSDPLNAPTIPKPNYYPRRSG
jgi:hypothetical protein